MDSKPNEHWCSWCSQMLPVESFFIRKERSHKAGKYQSGCKACRLERTQTKREANRPPPVQLPFPSLEKTCTGCGETMQLERFPWNSKCPWTREAKCWECSRARGREDGRKHKSRRSVYNKAYYWSDPEACHKRVRASEAKKPEYYKNRLRKYKRENKHLGHAYLQRYRARKMGNGGSWEPNDWERVKAQCDWRCVRCGLQEMTDGIKLTFDHVIPLSMGGYNLISNCQPMCLRCNAIKNAKFIDYRPDPYGLKKGIQ